MRFRIRAISENPICSQRSAARRFIVRLPLTLSEVEKPFGERDFYGSALWEGTFGL